MARWPVVLYFHHIHPALDHYTSLTPAAFDHALTLMLGSFAALSPHHLFSAEALSPGSEPSFLVSFDDGYRDTITWALPILDRHRIKAVFFVCTDDVGGRSPHDPTSDYLSWEDCATLNAGGHVVASHGRTHRRLDELSSTEVASEVGESLATLRTRLVDQPPLYAYPYGITADLPDDLPGRLLAFGTVKSPPAPWSTAPRSIRRTYLPTGREEDWPGIVTGWRNGWSAS